MHEWLGCNFFKLIPLEHQFFAPDYRAFGLAAIMWTNSQWVFYVFNISMIATLSCLGFLVQYHTNRKVPICVMLPKVAKVSRLLHDHELVPSLCWTFFPKKGPNWSNFLVCLNSLFLKTYWGSGLSPWSQTVGFLLITPDLQGQLWRWS
jgi:hypothetical protein